MEEMTVARSWGYRLDEGAGAACWWNVSRADRALMVAHARLERLGTALVQYDEAEETKAKAKTKSKAGKR